jgi:hypothetical protein
MSFMTMTTQGLTPFAMALGGVPGGEVPGAAAPEA